MSETQPHNDAEHPLPVPSQGAKDDSDVPRTFGQGQGVQDVRLVGQPAGWAAMANNMKEFDGEKFANVKDDIDSLLVFAGLFSAVLTAFVVESYKQLSPDTESAILTTSSQSLAVMQQISLQMSNPSIKPLNISTNSSSPPFQPSLADIRTNALWFSSLILSLITASFAILVKQWLREYAVFKITSPQSRLRVRHYRYLALQQWQVFAIAAALPLFQQIALGLFFAGLCVFTLSVHRSVHITSVTLVAAWAFLFVTTTFLPVFIPRCPYKTTLLNPIFTAIHFHVIRGSVELASWWFEKGLPTLVKLVMWWRKEVSSEDLRHRFKNYCDKLGQFVDNYTLTNDEAKIAQRDTADLVILGDADNLRSNDDLLGTTIFDSLKQIHDPPWGDIVKFVSRLLDHRLPPIKDSHTDSSSPQHRSLRTLSRSAYEGVIDILSHFLPPQIIKESQNPDSSHRDPTQGALLLFLSESRYPLPASGMQLLRLYERQGRMVSMLTSCLETEAQIASLLQRIDQVVKLDPERGFRLRENIWEAAVPDCLQSWGPSSLSRLLRAFDLGSCDDCHLHNLMSTLVHHSLRSGYSLTSFYNIITAIATVKYDDDKRHDIMIKLASTCLQSDHPIPSIHSLIEAIDEYNSPDRGKMIIALTHGCFHVDEPIASFGNLLAAIDRRAYEESVRHATLIAVTHGCLQLEVIGPSISLVYLIEAIDGRLYEQSDHHGTLVALTHGCIQITEPVRSLSRLIAAIDSRLYEESDRHAMWIALTRGCLQTTEPVTSLGHLIAAIDSRVYEESDRHATLIALTRGCLQTTEPATSLGHLIAAIDSRLYEESDRHATLIALTRGCLRTTEPVTSLGHLITALDSRLYEESDRNAALITLTHGCLQLEVIGPSISLVYLIEAIDGRLYEQSDHHGTLVALTHGCIQITEPVRSLSRLIAAIDSRAYKESGRNTALIAVTHGCLQLEVIGPSISLVHLIEAIDGRLYEESDHHGTLVALTRGCLQTAEPVRSLSRLIAIINDRAYAETRSDSHAVVFATVTQSCLESGDPATSLYSFIASIDDTYTAYDDEGEDHDLNGNRTTGNHSTSPYILFLSTLIHICSQSTIPGPMASFYYLQQAIKQRLLNTITCNSYELLEDAHVLSCHLQSRWSALSLESLLEAIGTKVLRPIVRHRDRSSMLSSYLKTARRVYRLKGEMSPSRHWQSMFSQTLEQSLETFEIVAKIIYEESGTLRHSQEFTLEEDFAAFQWNEDIWPAPIASEFMGYLADIVARSAHEETNIWENTNMPANFRLKGVLVCMWHLASLGTPNLKSTFRDAIAGCISQDKCTVALLEALDRTSGEVVVNVCSNMQRLDENFEPYMIQNLIDLISNINTVSSPLWHASATRSAQVTSSTSEYRCQPFTISHALKIAYFAGHLVHLLDIPTRIQCPEQDLFKAVARLVHLSVHMTWFLEEPGQVADDSTIILRFVWEMQRPHNLRNLDAFATLAENCLSYMKRGADLRSDTWNRFVKQLTIVYIASSPREKVLNVEPNLVEEVRNAVTLFEMRKQCQKQLLIKARTRNDAGIPTRNDVPDFEAASDEYYMPIDIADSSASTPTTETSDFIEESLLAPPASDIQEPAAPSASVEIQESTTTSME